LKSTGVLDCPDDPKANVVGAVSYIYNAAIPAMKTGATTSSVSGASGSAGCRPGVSGSIASMTSPAETVMLCEGTSYGQATGQAGVGSMDDAPYVGYGNYAGYTEYLTGWIDNCSNGGIASAATCGNWPFNYSGGSSAMTGLHTDGSNWLAADGHVKWMFGSKVSAGWAAATPNSPQYNGGGYWGGATAEGTAVGAHAMTFSPV